MCSFVLQRSTEQMRKVPTIVLSITYKGVKFIDAANKVSLCVHTPLLTLRVFRVISLNKVEITVFFL